MTSSSAPCRRVDGVRASQRGTGPHAGRRGSFRLRLLVVALAITQTVGYGVVYYAFGALLGPMSRDLDTSTATVAGAMTTALLVAAGLSVPVGRWLDARGGHGVMTTGSILAAIAVLAWSQVQTVVQLYAVFVAIGVASAMVLYPAAFAVVVAVAAPANRTERSSASR